MILPHEIARIGAYRRLWCALFHWRGYWYPEYPNIGIDGHGTNEWTWRCSVKGCPRNPRHSSQICGSSLEVNVREMREMRG